MTGDASLLTGVEQFYYREARMQQHIGSSLTVLGDKPYFYGPGAGEERPHPELPGRAGCCCNERFAGNFYLRRREDMQREGTAKS